MALPGAAMQALAAAPAGKPVSLDRVESFLAIGADGSVTCYTGKVDLGTGAQKALAQIVADELTLPVERVSMVMGDTLLTPDQGVTFGSLTIEVGGVQIRQAAATARAALTSEAARLWQVDPGELTTEDGAVRARAGAGARRIGYGELVRGKGLELPVNTKAALLDPSRYRYVGRTVPRWQPVNGARSRPRSS